MNKRGTTSRRSLLSGAHHLHRRFLAGLAAAASSVAGVGLVLMPTASSALAVAPAATDKPQDVLVFPDGRTIEGWILEETPTSIKFRGIVQGLTFEREYQRTEILTIRKGGASGAAPGGSAPGAAPATTATPASATSPSGSPLDPSEIRQRYYYVELVGQFGSDISQTPIRNALRDAKNQNADVVIFYIDAEWKNPFTGEELKNVNAAFDQIFRAEPMTVVLTDEVQEEWSKPPRIVFWVQQAMAGAAFLPLVSPEIYFKTDGRMGGIGNLGEMFGSTGDEVVREKQRSLRLGHAEGWAIRGGYDPRIIRAMARREYVLSYRIKDGKPELFEGMPANPGEELLTDDGENERVDSMRDIVAGTGNDVLTLTARTAKAIGVSKGTIDSRDDLLLALGLDRGAADVSGRSKRIQDDWKQGLADARRRILRTLEEMGNIQGDQSTREGRNRIRGQQRRALETIKSLLERWGEGLDGFWLQQNNVPDVATINVELERIRLEQMKDRP